MCAHYAVFKVNIAFRRYSFQVRAPTLPMGQMDSSHIPLHGTGGSKSFGTMMDDASSQISPTEMSLSSFPPSPQSLSPQATSFDYAQSQALQAGPLLFEQGDMQQPFGYHTHGNYSSSIYTTNPSPATCPVNTTDNISPISPGASRISLPMMGSDQFGTPGSQYPTPDVS